MRVENLHNHSTFSDGIFTPEDIILYAISCDLEGIGICDHYSTKKVRSVIHLEKYFKELNYLKNKYGEDIRIYSGLEIDFSPRSDVYGLISNIELLMDYCDYLLFEYVADTDNKGYGIEDFFKTRELLYDIPIGLAHTFIEKNIIPRSPDLALRLCNGNVFIELCSGNRNLYNGVPNFIESFDFIIANKDLLKFSAGSDTHRDLREVELAEEALDFIRRNQLHQFSPEIKIHPSH